jgi:plastocyanin
VLVSALSTGNKIGLAVVALAFIAFALGSAMLVPRYRPDFPGRRGLRLFIVVTVLFFAGMIAAVAIFGREKEEVEHEATAGESATNAGSAARTVDVTEKDFKIELATKTFSKGSYVLHVTNNGPSQHDVVVSGPQVNNAKTPLLAAGKTADLKVALGKGTYELYCDVPGHKQLGMDVKITVA